MTPAETDHLTVLGIAVACLLPALPAGWKAASWRGDVFKKWDERVELAHAGLNEQATSELVALREEISDALGGAEGFTPAQVSADPDPLVRRANRCASLLVARDKLRGRFRRYRKLGPALIPTVLVYLGGWLLATLYYTDVVGSSSAKWLGFVLSGAAVAGGILIFGLYAYYESKLTAAEEMASGERA